MAGLTVAIVAFPLSIALAIASGASPEKGLVTAIIAGFLISFFGGSRVQIGGPTGAFVVIVVDIINKHGYEGLLTSTFMAGIILLIAAFLKAGVLIKYISQSVITGFTTGIALIILVSQVGDIFGFGAASLPPHVFQKILFVFSHSSQIKYPLVIAVGGLTLLLILLNKYFPKIPGLLIIVGIGMLSNTFLSLGFETIGDRFGNISLSLPQPHFPLFSWSLFLNLLPSAFIIALLAGVESLLSAVVADSLCGDQHHSNTELLSQGLANIGSSLFMGLPATGAIARTAVNIKAGAVSPVSGIIHALGVALFSFLLVKYIQMIPFCSLAAILIVVALGMGELPAFIKLATKSVENALVLLTTFLLTLFSDLTVGISTGIILSSLIFMKNMSETFEVKEQSINLVDVGEKELIKDIHIFSFEGPLFFGSSPRVLSALKKQHITSKILILNFQHVPFVDQTAAAKLKEFIDTFENHTKIILCIPKKSVREALKKYEVKEKIPSHHVVENLHQAVALAEKNLKENF